MKRSSILSLSAIALRAGFAIALIVFVPFLDRTPALAGFEEVTTAITKAINRPEVKLNLAVAKQVKEKDEQGKETIAWEALKNEALVMPGDILQYTIASNNAGDRPAADLVVTQPIPKGTNYILSSANSDNQAKITYSIDNGQSFVEKPYIKVKLADGTVEEKPAPAEVYTHVRWKFDNNVKPETAIKAAYNVKVQ